MGESAELPVRQVTAPIANHGEGPVWDPDHKRVLWVDMLAGDILETDPVTGETQRHVGPEDVAAVLCRTGGEWLLAGRHHLWRGTFGDWRQCASLPLSVDERANEGACSETGELFVGTMREDEAAGTGAVYRYDGDHVAPALTGTTISNGMAFSSGECWFIDSPTQEIRRYKISDTGQWTSTEDTVSTREFAGIPDGMARDTEGGFWVAMYAGSAVVRFAATGEPTDVVKIPAACPTSCCFGGEDGTELFVTTSRYGRDPQDDPQAGSLFAVRTGYRGAARFGFSAVDTRNGLT